MGTHATLEDIRRIYAEATTIAVVGASTDPAKPAHFVPRYLQEQGYTVIPVTPAHDEVLGERTYPTLQDVPGPIDVVEVFRPGAEAPGLARAAVAAGAKAFWMQIGVISEEAADIASEAGLLVVMDRCMGQMHAKLGLGPGPHH